MGRLIDKDKLIAEYDRVHQGPPGGARKLMEDAPVVDRWIPVTKEMPEEHEWIGTKQFGTTISDEVYVTFENPKGERFTKHLSFQNGKVPNFEQRTIDAFYKGSVPIAWMPLPEPWKGE